MVKVQVRGKPYSVEVIAGVSGKTVPPLLPNCLGLRCLNTFHTDIKRQNDVRRQVTQKDYLFRLD